MPAWMLVALGVVAFVAAFPTIVFLIQWIRHRHGPAYTVMFDVTPGPDQTIWVRAPDGERLCLSMPLEWPLLAGATMHFSAEEVTWIDVKMEVNHT